MYTDWRITMKCKQCKHQMEEDVKYCRNCGMKIKETNKSSRKRILYILIIFSLIGLLLASYFLKDILFQVDEHEKELVDDEVEEVDSSETELIKKSEIKEVTESKEVERITDINYIEESGIQSFIPEDTYEPSIYSAYLTGSQYADVLLFYNYDMPDIQFPPTKFIILSYDEDTDKWEKVHEETFSLLSEANKVATFPIDGSRDAIVFHQDKYGKGNETAGLVVSYDEDKYITHELEPEWIEYGEVLYDEEERTVTISDGAQHENFTWNRETMNFDYATSMAFDGPTPEANYLVFYNDEETEIVSSNWNLDVSQGERIVMTRESVGRQINIFMENIDDEEFVKFSNEDGYVVIDIIKPFSHSILIHIGNSYGYENLSINYQ